jgi:hypothetical protein
MSDEKEIYIGPIEQEISSMMETANDAIIDITFAEKNKDADKIALKICINTIGKCICDLAKEIDKLSKSIK